MSQIHSYCFQAHPAYAAQIDHLRHLDGFELVTALDQGEVEHARWQSPNSIRLRNLTMPLQTRLRRPKTGLLYVSGTFPPSAYHLAECGVRMHVDADDSMSILTGGSRNRLPASIFRTRALRLARAVRAGHLTISLWSEIQLSNFLANFRHAESRELLDRGRISVLPPAINSAAVDRAIGTCNTLKIVSVAAGKFWGKGVPDAIAACAQALEAGANIELVLIGGGVPQSWLQPLASLPWVKVTGRITREAIEHELKKADLLMFPSHHDTFGWVVIEAKRYGVPTLATDFYNRSEIVSHGVDGLLVSDPYSNPYRPVSEVQYSEAHLGITPSGEILSSDQASRHIRELSLQVIRLEKDRALLAKLGQGARLATTGDGKFSVQTRLSKLTKILND